MRGTPEDAIGATVTDLTDHGRCTGCGECCSNILPLSDREVREIKHYVKAHNIKEQKHFIIGMAEKPDYDLCCPFMKPSGNKRCTIYEVRPEVCRNFICNRKELSLALLSEKRKAVMMRETFFGKQSTMVARTLVLWQKISYNRKWRAGPKDITVEVRPLSIFCISKLHRKRTGLVGASTVRGKMK